MKQTVTSLAWLVIKERNLRAGGVIAAVAAVAPTLIDSILGGSAGRRFHRTVVQTGSGSRP